VLDRCGRAGELEAVYDVVFAGIPYPDPTSEMTAAYARHAGIAAAIRWGGLGLVLAGVAGGVVRRLAHR